MEVPVMTVLLTAAGFFDVKERKIPNFLIVGGWGFALVFHLLRDGLQGVFSCITAIVITILLCFLLFLLHVIGAGDIKLLSVIGAVHGLGFLWQVVLVWLTLAGGVCVVVMLKRQLMQERFWHLWNYLTVGRACGISYYDRERDGDSCTIVLAPIMVLAYLLVQIGRWNGFC